jgi:PTH1 family peptidyl-tRNA hydrolase
MHYIVGLGNPGKEYAHTRHNAGFLLLSAFIESSDLPAPRPSRQHRGLLSEGVFAGEEVMMLMPSTYMNASGGAVAKLVPREEVERLIVLYDDVDLPLGEVRVSFGRGDGGHNGIRSVAASLGTKDFARLRIGIAKKHFWSGTPVRPKGDELAAYVLGAFTAKEEVALLAQKEKIAEIMTVFVKEGVAAAMNRFN